MAFLRRPLVVFSRGVSSPRSFDLNHLYLIFLFQFHSEATPPEDIIASTITVGDGDPINTCGEIITKNNEPSHQPTEPPSRGAPSAAGDMEASIASTIPAN